MIPATDLLRERARLTPRKIALVDVATGERFTYGDLDARVSALARGLRETLELAKGERVGVLAGNVPEVIEAFFAAGRAGLVLVPLNTKAPAGELVTIVEDCGLETLVYGAEHAATVEELRRQGRDLTGVVLGDAEIGGDRRYEDLLAAAGAVPFVPHPPGLEETYCLLYTSGTTGKPKGVMLPHRMILANACNTALSWQLRDSDVSPLFTPLYHAGGLAVFLTPLVAAGGTLVLHRTFDAAEVWRTVETEGCTVMLGVPTIFQMLLDAPELDQVDTSSIRWLISGGAPLPPELVEAYRRRDLVLKQGYGLTEVGVNCFSMTEAEALEKAGSIGKPLMFTEAKLVNEEGAEVTGGEVGELCLRGPHVSSGYWKRPEETAAAYNEDGFFHTGDLARRDEEGFFWIAGRRKEMFISGGVNVYPAEVEMALGAHPGVADVAVVGVADDKWGEVGVAFLVAEPEARPGDDELRDFLGRRLARYKTPRDFVWLDELPRTLYGKVVKGKLARLYGEGSAS